MSKISKRFESQLDENFTNPLFFMSRRLPIRYSHLLVVFQTVYGRDIKFYTIYGTPCVSLYSFQEGKPLKC